MHRRVLSMIAALSVIPPLLGAERAGTNDRCARSAALQTGPQDGAYYYLAAILTHQPGRIAVVRGKAPIAPDTRDGEPVTAPQDLRYWSLCNNTNALPFPVVACKADFETAVDGQGFYTYVVATPEDLPANAATDPTVTVLPWGSTEAENALILRNMLPSSTFHQATQDVKATPNCSLATVPPAQAAVCAQGVMGAYYPTAFYCEKPVYEAQGWQGCLPQ